MRGHPIRVLVTGGARLRSLLVGCAVSLLLLGALTATQSARGQRVQPGADPEVGLRLAVPERLTAGTAAMIDVFVRLPPGPEQPLLLTPVSEGEAVRVVRGRLLRADARKTTQGELHFQVPIEARAAGTAVLRISLLTYHCELRCRAVRAVETRTVQVGGG